MTHLNRQALTDSPVDRGDAGAYVIVPITVTNRSGAPQQVPSPLLVVGDDQFLQAYEGVTDPALLWGRPPLPAGDRREHLAVFARRPEAPTAPTVVGAQVMLSSPDGQASLIPLR